MSEKKQYVGDGVYVDPCPYDDLGIELTVSDGCTDTQIIVLGGQEIVRLMQILDKWGILPLPPGYQRPKETESRPLEADGAGDENIRW